MFPPKPFYCSGGLVAFRFFLDTVRWVCVETLGLYVCVVITYSKGKDQPGKVANPARGQLNRETDFFPVPVSA